MRALGLFALARRLSRKRLRILCYHGFSVEDQHRFNPMLYMTIETFEARIRRLKSLGYPVATLQDGLQQLQANAITDSTTVVTIDDGWSTTRRAAEVLSAQGVPATLYSTTYYSLNPVSVFNVTLAYILWRSKPQTIRLTEIHPDIDGTHEASLQATLADKLIGLAEQHLSREGREALLKQVAKQCGMESALDGRFKLLTPDELKALAAYGVDVQLHTHRHQLPAASYEATAKEIVENRQLLEAWLGRSLTHFCYPSGQYGREHPEWLARLGVESATTCDPGLNSAGGNAYELRRFLDSETTPMIEFEAELSGFKDWMRKLTGLVRPQARQHY
jgi:peptidoglycan/xylan/chitin deacetylase (PgdA/CDA1 family)